MTLKFICNNKMYCLLYGSLECIVLYVSLIISFNYVF